MMKVYNHECVGESWSQQCTLLAFVRSLPACEQLKPSPLQ